MAVTVSIPRGTRDFSPDELRKRKFIFSTIERIFTRYGYQPLETPAMEQLSTLTGKYGAEGDRLIFKILNSGNFTEGISAEDFAAMPAARLSARICEKALRYDLTVPFARYVVMHRNEIVFPFKRYQIQNVWRADRPQKGRYREFTQCDADVIGSRSLLNEMELVKMVDDVFSVLDMKVVIKLNNRKILAGMAELIGAPEKITVITTAIDKMEKIGQEKVNHELSENGLSDDDIGKIKPILNLSGSFADKMSVLQNLIGETPSGKAGIEETRELFGLLDTTELRNAVELDLTLARGLDYYTGAIIEVKAMDVEMGSICGGGRYDDLTGIFGAPGLSGVGISFGADRICDVMNQLKKFPEDFMAGTQVLFLNFGGQEMHYALAAVVRLRNEGIAAELYPDAEKIKKQFSYADQRSIPFVAIAGPDEFKEKVFKLKNMKSGFEEKITAAELADRLKK